MSTKKRQIAKRDPETGEKTMPAPEEVAAYYKELVDAHEKVTCKLTLVSPRLASELLAKNSGNRAIVAQRVKRYERLILSGLWEINGETVIIDENDELMNGQHRLSAIVAAGIAAPLFIVRPIQRSTFKSIDTGGTRSGGDVFGIQGELNANCLSAATRWLYRYQHGYMLGLNQSVAPSNAELWALLQENPGLRDSVSFVLNKCKRGLYAGGPMSFLHYVCTQNHPGKVNEFFDQVLSQIGLVKGSPAQVLHERITREALRARQLGQLEKLALAVKAWNAYITGRPIGTLKWARLGDNAEAFPAIL